MPPPDITEAALRSSAERLRAMYDRTHEYIGLLSPDGTLLEANRASLSFADSNREEVIGLPFWTTIWFRFTPGAPEKIRAAVTCAAAGEQVRFEAPIVTPSNEVKTFELSFDPIRNDTGEIIIIVAEGRDITERRKTEQDLRVSEERLRLATDAAGLGIWSWDITQDLVTWENDWPYGFFGIDRSDGAINAASFKADFLYPDDVAQFDSAVAEVSKPGHRFHFVGRVRRKNGDIRWVEFTGRSMADIGGKATHMHGTAADVTDRKHAEGALRESEERFRAMANAITQLAWIARPDGHIFWYNQRWYEYTGTTPEQMEGWGWQTVHDEAELPNVLERWKVSIATGQPFEMTFPLRGADSVFRQFLTRVFPLKNPQNVVVQWFGTNTDVDEIARAQSALRESNDRMLLATEATSVGVWERNVLTNQIRWDAQMFRIYGIDPTPDGIVPYTVWSRCVLPDDLPEQEKLLLETVRHVGRGLREFRIRRANDDACRYIQAVETARTNERGKVEWLVGTNLDVTERKRAEEALIKSERFNVAVLNSLPAEIAVLDREGQVIAVNGPWAEFAEKNPAASPERVGVGVNFLATCRKAAANGDDMARRTLEGITGVIEGQTAEFQMEYPCHTPDRQRWFALQVVRPSAEVGGAIVAHTDITERHRTEKLLIEQDSLLESIATGGPLDECLSALCTAVSRLNPRTRACVFLATADGVGFGRAISPALTAEFTKGIASAPMEEVGAGVCAAAALSGYAVTCANISADQRWSPVWQKLCLSHEIHACHSAPVRDNNGRVAAVLTLYFDEAREPSDWELCVSEFGTYLASIVLERDRVDTALRHAKEAAEAANQAKDHFLAVLSHELRTPLTPVMMAVGALEHDPGLRPEVREDIVMIKRNVELETKLIDDLLDVSRITSGKVELKIEAVDLNEAVRNVCDICRPQLAEHHVHLKMELVQDVCAISVDPARLQQVLWNVLKNAVKFTPAQGTVRVTTARLGSGKCEVRVQDSGIGIPPDVLPRIFNAFEQGDAHITRQFGGLGLGLAISRLLVELHGGTIRAESEGAGKGATFVVELPGHAASSADAPTAPDADRQRETTQIRLLLVEDHSDTARTLARLLRAAGFSVTATVDVASALATAGRESFDVILSDLGLPDGDGYEIMRAIRARGIIPGIAMSGYGMEEDIRRSREAGFSEHLVKPVAVPELIAAIRRVTETRD